MYWDGSCVSASASTPCSSPKQLIPSHSRSFCVFPCEPTEYLYWDGSCDSVCPFPYTSSQEKGRSFCNYPCTSGYLYWDGTCQSSCSDPPLEIGTYKNKPLCLYRCSVETDFLYPDGTCASTCASPLTVLERFNKLFCTSICSASQYLYWDGTCQNSCSNPPLSSLLFHNTLVCKFPCSSSTEYAYPDGSCASTCPFPRTVRVSNERSYCESSCSPQRLYWDGSCSSTCPGPLQTGSPKGISLCSYTCTDLTQYLYWNGSCSSTCNSPFVQTILKDRNFCTFPCSFPTAIMNWDGTCVSGCTSLYIPVAYGGQNYCRSPCNTGEYMLADGACVPTCDYPLVQSSLEGAFYCNSPCPSTQFFSPSTESCLDLCPSPFVIVKQSTVSVCGISCSSTQFRVLNGSCVNSCPFPMIVVTTTHNGKECVSPCSGSVLQYYDSETQQCTDYCFSDIVLHDGLYLECAFIPSGTNLIDYLLTATSKLDAATVLTLTDLLGYIKYSDISLSPRLQGLAANRGRNIITIKFGFLMPQALQEKFTQGSLPTSFERFGTPSNFLVNFWLNLTSWLIVVLAGLTFIVFQEVAKQNDWLLWHSIFGHLKTIVFWNFLIMQYVTSIGDIIIFISIQFRALQMNGVADIISLVFAILLLVSIPLFIFLLSRHYSKTHLPFGQSLVPPEKAQKYQVTIQGYSAKAKKFYLTYIIRIIILSVISAALVGTGVTQAVFNTLISLAMVIYIIKNKPIKRKLNYIQLVCLEVIVLFTNFFMFLFCISSGKGNALTTSGIFFADLVILGNFCIHILFILFLFAKFIIIGQDLFKLYKINKDLAKTGCLHFVIAYLQQGAFGFEEIIQLDLTPPEKPSEDEKRNLVNHNYSQHQSKKSLKPPTNSRYQGDLETDHN